MIKVLKYPKTKLVRIFNCKCGCQFQADLKDFEISNFFIGNDPGLTIYKKLTYKAKCPFCQTYSQYNDTNSEYKEIEIDTK